ncbi:putative Response regulator Rcp1 [delta proteobacterium NaphS2]|nr:putative Response regulator Rcp1 [delta proteobacterium NaphS2]
MRFQNKRCVMPSTILMAEDDHDDRFLIRRAFDALEINAVLRFVGDGEELMNYLKGNSDGKDLEGFSSPPALLFLDLNMPKKDGREALLAIRSDPNLRDLPIVIWTTSNRAADKIFCKENGANTYVTKPNSFKKLVTEIRKILGEWLPQTN